MDVIFQYQLIVKLFVTQSTEVKFKIRQMQKFYFTRLKMSPCVSLLLKISLTQKNVSFFIFFKKQGMATLSPENENHYPNN